MQNLSMPHILYHGTSLEALPSFQRCLLDPSYWNPKRDFGAGFYTTISLTQAKSWAKHVANEDTPCVLQIELLKLPRAQRVKVFLSPSLEWSTYIFRHRKRSPQEPDPCGERHADLIIGPCADEDTGTLTQEVVKLKKSLEWYHQAILRSKKGRSLDPGKLATQIVFSNPSFEPYLKLVGYFVLRRGVWRYAEIQTVPGARPL